MNRSVTVVLFLVLATAAPACTKAGTRDEPCRTTRANDPGRHVVDRAAARRAAGSMGTISVDLHAGFVENRGQVADTDGRPRPDILYTANLGTAWLFFTRSGVSTVFHRKRIERGVSEATGCPPTTEDERESTTDFFRLDMRLEGANSTVAVSGEAALERFSNYYLGHCPSGVTGVRSYRVLVYRDVYDCIDLVYRHAGSGRLKYEFVVRPGADPSAIRMRYNGGAALALTEDGGLRVETPLGSIEESRPFVHQDGAAVNGCAFVLHKNEAGFAIGAYDTSKTLVIDPWGIFIGGSDLDQVIASSRDGSMNFDISGNLLVCGRTESTNFPTIAGFQTTPGGWVDGFIARCSSTGTLGWSTYIGGSNIDVCHDVDDDASGNVYVAGITGSSNFPVQNAWQTALSNSYDAFVARFTSTGSLQWSSFYGGNGEDAAMDLCLTAAGDLIVVGHASAGFPVVSPVQPHGGNVDGLVMKLTPTGTPIIATYFGGNSTDKCTSIDIDANGNCAIVGTTWSTNFPVLNPQYPSSSGGVDMFISAWDTSLSPTWATYFGGPGADAPEDVLTMPSGDIYIIGYSAAAGLPLVQPYSQWSGGAFDAYIARFSSSRICTWATYFGGSGDDGRSGLCADATGNIYAIGRTKSANFPVLNAMQPTHSNVVKYDIFIASFDPNNTLAWSTYFGGDADDMSAVLLVAGGELFVCGQSNSTDLSAKYGFPPKPGLMDIMLFSLTTSGVFPVELSSLAARISGGRAQIAWITESESGNAGFEVQRLMQPGSGTWEIRGFIPGSGTSSQRREYVFSDELPPGYAPYGSVSYRLRQIDLDGTERYSSTVEAVLDGRQEAGATLDVHPQPARGALTVRCNGFSGEATLRLVDALGRVVRTVRISTVRDVPMDVADCPAGAYMLVAERDGVIAARRLLLY